MTSEPAPAKRLLRAGIIAVIAVQFLVPAIALTRTPPTRFGFQMYAGTGILPGLTTVDAAGREQVVPLTSIAASGRAEIDWPGRAVRYLCRTRPGIRAVRVTGDGPPRTVSC